MSATGEQPSSFGPVDRRAVASVATQFFVNGAIFASFIPRLPEIRDRLDVSIDVLGALITTAGLIGGATILIATLPFIGFATAPVVFVVALGLMASVDVIVDVSMNLQGSWLSARRHAPIMNRLHGLWSLGTVTGGVAAAQLTASGVSLQAHMVGVAIVLGLALIFVSRGLLRVDEHVDEDPASTGDKPKTTNRSALVVLAVLGAFAIAVELVSSDWAAFRLSDDFGTSAGFAGLGYVAFTSGMTAGRFGGDWALERVGHDRLNQAAVIASTIGLAGASLLPNRYVVLLAYIVAGIGISTFFPRLYDEAAQLRGKRGAGLAALTAGSRIAGLAVPVAVGTLAATSLSVGAATALIVIPSVIGFALLSFASR